ncbi:hypothetical protein [Ralstonia syzygii]|uniref:hypothetical protein n=1 Tax=Ralstonia syzygii TaxID=28097 RepID=UPI0036F1F581
MLFIDGNSRCGAHCDGGNLAGPADWCPEAAGIQSYQISKKSEIGGPLDRAGRPDDIADALGVHET